LRNEDPEDVQMVYKEFLDIYELESDIECSLLYSMDTVNFLIPHKIVVMFSSESVFDHIYADYKTM